MPRNQSDSKKRFTGKKNALWSKHANELETKALKKPESVRFNADLAPKWNEISSILDFENEFDQPNRI